MDNWRRSQYARMPRGRVYIPSGWNANGRRGRPRRRGEGAGPYGNAPMPRENMYERFFRQPPEDEAAQPTVSQLTADEKADGSHRFHRRSRAKTQLPAPPARAAEQPRPQESRPVGIEPPPPPAAVPHRPPVYPYYPAAPAYYPPPPPPPAYVPCDEHGRPLSRREIARIEASEAYEDRFGRDFDRYADDTASAGEKKELFPRNYLSESDQGSSSQ